MEYSKRVANSRRVGCSQGIEHSYASTHPAALYSSSGVGYLVYHRAGPEGKEVWGVGERAHFCIFRLSLSRDRRREG